MWATHHPPPPPPPPPTPLRPLFKGGLTPRLVPKKQACSLSALLHAQSNTVFDSCSFNVAAQRVALIGFSNRHATPHPHRSSALMEMPTDHRNHRARFIAFLAPTGILFFGPPRPKVVALFGISRQNPSRLTESDPPGGLCWRWLLFITYLDVIPFMIIASFMGRSLT